MRRNILLVCIMLVFINCVGDNQLINQNIRTFKNEMIVLNEITDKYFNYPHLFSHFPKEIDNKEYQGFNISYSRHDDDFRVECYYIVNIKDSSSEVCISKRNLKEFELYYFSDDFCTQIQALESDSFLQPIPNISDILDTNIIFEKILKLETNNYNYCKLKNEKSKPICMKRWKYGLSKGIGIYKDNTGWKKMYWAMIW